MAELELTKIENGMANGGTAIGKNFDAVGSAVNAQRYVAPKVIVPIAGVGVVSDTNLPLRYWRQGNMVYLDGQGTFPKKNDSTTFWNIPAGYTPAHTTDTVYVHESTVATVAILHFEPSGGAHINMVTDNAHPISMAGTCWPTTDDFPD